MTEKKTWFITRAGRGMGVDFAKAALAAGHAVVATGRNPNAIGEARPPRRFIAGTDAIGLAAQKVATLEAEIDAYDELSSSLAHEDATAGVS